MKITLVSVSYYDPTYIACVKSLFTTAFLKTELMRLYV